MGTLFGGIENFFGNLGNDVSDFFGGGAKKQPQDQSSGSQQIAPGLSSLPKIPNSNPNPAPAQAAPSINLTQLSHLQKATPSPEPQVNPNPQPGQTPPPIAKPMPPAPAPAASQPPPPPTTPKLPAFFTQPLQKVNQQAINPENPVVSAVKSFAQPAISDFQNMEKANNQITQNEKPGILPALESTGQQALNFGKAIGLAGADYAPYVAPELKTFGVAEDAPLLVKAASGFLQHGATSAPLSVAASLASGNKNPANIAQNAAIQTAGAGVLGPILQKVGDFFHGPTPDAPVIKSESETGPPNGLPTNDNPTPQEAKPQPSQSIETPPATGATPLPATEPPVTAATTAPGSPEAVAPASLPQEPKLAISPTQETQLDQTQSPSQTPNINSEPNVAQVPPTVKPSEPVLEPPPVLGGETAPNAPELRDALNRQLTGLSDRIGKDASTHTVMSNQELTDTAEEWAKGYSDPELALQYATPTKLTSAADMAKANAALHRLVKLPESESNNTAIDNIVTALEEHSSNAGRSQNYLQHIYGNLPKEAKIPVMIRQIDKARAEANLPLVRDSVTKRAEVNARLNNLLSELEDIAGRQNTAETADQAAADQIKANPNVDKQTAQNLLNQAAEHKTVIDQAKNDYQAKQGDIARYVNEVSGNPKPGNVFTRGVKKAAELQKSLMLASLSGPMNDATLSGMNAAREFANLGVSSLAGKAGNALSRQPGKYISKLPSLKTFLKGNNFAKTVGEMKGNLYTPEARGLSKASGDGRSGLLQKADNSLLTKFNAKVHATREMATNLTAGMKSVKIQQLADQEGRQAGLKGQALKVYTALRSNTPTPNMVEQGTKLTEEVNNMNDNPLSRMLGSKGSGLSKIPGVGPLIQNLWQPFSQWVGSQGWNAITDQNMVANLTKAIVAGTRGDTQGIVDNLSKLAVNTGITMTAGFGLTAAGYLTTDHGTSTTVNSGLSFHVPGTNNYIPVTFFGGAAPSLIMGYATYNALHGPAGSSPSQEIANIAGETFKDTYLAYAGGTPLGGNNSVIGPYGVITQLANAANSKNNTTPTDVASGLATDEASMFVPGAASDVNAINASLNPGLNAPETTIKSIDAKGNLANNQVASNNAYLESRIPGLNQLMPTNPAKAAPNFLSRYTRGSNSTGPQAAAAAEAKAPGSPAQIKIQEAADKAAFTAGTQQQATLHGIVYERDSKGSVTATPVMTYQYNQYKSAQTDTKNSGDLTGYTSASNNLLSNISQQLQSGKLDKTEQDTMVKDAMATQKSLAEYSAYGGFTKPKGAATFKGVGNISGAKSGYVPAIQLSGAKYGVDINALLAVASMEGLGGGVGDNGTSFGPFQLHVGGALPAGKTQAWAESPAGIDYAVQQISKVAGGLTGQQAINAIVNNFEKPLNPTNEINGALDIYNGGDVALTPGSPGGASVTAAATSGTTAKVGTLKAPTTLTRVNLATDLKPVKITSAIPLQKVDQPNSVIKRRTISVKSPSLYPM